MEVGDLVVPKNSCAGEPGALRCKWALVVETNHDRAAPGDPEYIKVVCPCGSASDYSWHFEKVSDND